MDKLSRVKDERYRENLKQKSRRKNNKNWKKRQRP
jgi:hypothetical protein